MAVECAFEPGTAFALHRHDYRFALVHELLSSRIFSPHAMQSDWPGHRKRRDSRRRKTCWRDDSQYLLCQREKLYDVSWRGIIARKISSLFISFRLNHRDERIRSIAAADCSQSI